MKARKSENKINKSSKVGVRKRRLLLLVQVNNGSSKQSDW